MIENSFKTGFICILASVVLIVIAGCSSTTLSQDRITDLPPESIVLSPTGGEQSFVLTFSDNWRIENSNPEWIRCDLPGRSTEGTYIITVYSGVNRSREDRNGNISFISDDGSKMSIPVYQPCPYLNVRILDQYNDSPVQNDSLVFKWNDSSRGGFSPYIIHIDSNVDWKIQLAEDRGSDNFMLSALSGTGSRRISLTTRDNNIDVAPFESLMSIDAYMPGENPTVIGDGVDSYFCNLHQNNLKFLINGSCEDITVGIDELNDKIKNGDLIVDSELSWGIVGGTDWVRLSGSSFQEGESYLGVRADGVNPTLERRQKDIVLRSSGGAERVLHVEQDPYILDFGDQKIQIGNDDLSSKVIRFETSGPWEITNIPYWLEVSPTKGERGVWTITLGCVEQNLDLKDKIASLNFRSTLNGGPSKPLSVTQDKFLFDIIPDETLSKIPTLSTLYYDAQIVSSGKWSISSSQSWVKFSTTSGSKDRMIKIGSNSTNPNMDSDRISKITLVSETHKEKGITLTKVIDVVQRRFMFSIATDATSIPAYTEGKLKLEIVCSGPWELSSYPNWLVPDKKSGEFDSSVYFSVNTNTSKSTERSGVIKVLSKYNGQSLDTPKLIQDKFVFDVSKKTISNLPPVGVAQQTVTLSCTNEVGWYIESSDWTNASVTSGKGNATLSFSPLNNPTTSNRTKSVSIKNRVTSEVLNITFSQNRFEFSVTESSLGFTELDASTKTLHITCSSGWTIDSGGNNWIHFSPSTGTGNATVSVTIDKNVGLSERTASITVYSNLQHGTSGELSKKVTIRQDAYRFDSNSVSREYDAILNSGGTEVFSVPVTCSGAWTVSTDAAWVSAAPMSGTGNGSIRVTVESNKTFDGRNATVSIRSSDNSSLAKQVYINQKGFVLNASASVNTIGMDSKSQSFTINVDCASKWTVSTNASWITLSKTSGTGKDSINVSLDQNKDKKSRSGSIEIKSEYGPSRTISVSQNGK